MKMHSLWTWLRRSLRFWLDAAQQAFNPEFPAADLRKIACARCGAGFPAAELRPVELGFLCGPCDAAELTERQNDASRLIYGPERQRARCHICAQQFQAHRDTLVYCAVTRRRWSCPTCVAVGRIFE